MKFGETIFIKELNKLLMKNYCVNGGADLSEVLDDEINSLQE